MRALLDESIRIVDAERQEYLAAAADAVLGAVNAAGLGESTYIGALRETNLLQARTPESLGE